MSASTPASSAAAPAGAIDDRPVLETRNRPLVMAAVVAVTMCMFFDATIANVALPHMRAQLGASSDQISWVLTSFMIAQAIATPITGWLSDRLGSRNLFLGATALFLLASAACGAATSLSAMIVFRVIQGIAAAFIGPMSQTTMFDITPPSKQGMAMAIFGIMVMVGPITGPALGGFLTEYLSWRWIFYVNLPIGIPAFAILWWGLPSRPISARRLDLFGFVAIAIALGAMQLALDRGQHKDWFESWEIIIEAIIALSALWIFIIHTRTAPEPLFRRELWANRPFLFAISFMAVLGISVIGLSAVLPMLFQSIYGYSVIDSGLMLAPRGLGVVLTSFVAGWVIRNYDFRLSICLGYLLAAFGMWSMTGWSLVMDKDIIYLAIFIQGLGLGMIFSPINLMAFSTLPPSDRPDGASLLALARSFGGSIGISLIVTMLSRSQQTNHADIGAHVTSNSVPGFDWSGMIDRMGGAGAGVMVMIDSEVNRQAMMIAFLDSFYLMAIGLAVLAPLPFILKRGLPNAGGQQSMASD